jgi:hypothetical protein
LAHRETEHFFATSGVQIAHSTSGLFHFHRTVFSSQIKQKSAAPSPRMKLYVSILTLTGNLSQVCDCLYL